MDIRPQDWQLLLTERGAGFQNHQREASRRKIRYNWQPHLIVQIEFSASFLLFSPRVELKRGEGSQEEGEIEKTPISTALSVVEYELLPARKDSSLPTWLLEEMESYSASYTKGDICYLR